MSATSRGGRLTRSASAHPLVVAAHHPVYLVSPTKTPMISASRSVVISADHAVHLDALTIQLGPRSRRRARERPPLRWPTSFAAQGRLLLNAVAKWIRWQHQKVLLAITRCRTAASWVDIAISARTADIPPSLTTRAATALPKCQGNARVRWLDAREQELLPTRMSMCLHPAAGTSSARIAEQAAQSTTCCFIPALQPCWRSPRSPAPWRRDWLLQHAPYLGPTTATSPPCTLRSRRWRSRSRPLPLDLFPLHIFFYPSGVLSRVFRGKFVAGLKNAFREGALHFHGQLSPLAQPRMFAPGSNSCSAMTGSSTPSGHSVERNTP